MPTVATSPSTLVHSCEGMYFKPSMTVRVATREARSSVFALRASRLLASRSRASLKGPIRTFYPRRVSRTASPFARRRARPLARDVTDVPRARSRASSLARASSRARSRTSDAIVHRVLDVSTRRVARSRSDAPVEYARAPTAVAHMGANAVVRFVHLKSADRADIAQSTLAEPVVDVCARATRRPRRDRRRAGLSSAFYRRSTHGLKRASNAWK